MGVPKKPRLVSLGLLSISALIACNGLQAATQPVDLDALPANGAESMCSTNVLNPFPVRIENTVTNRANGDAFTFSWPSAGPGGFRSSVTAGTTNGVGATWVWTTDQSIVGFTGNSCPTDACFTQTAGPDQAGGFCSDACLADATSLSVRKGQVAGTFDITWTGGTSTFTVYRGSTKIGVVAPANSVGTTNAFTFTDTPPANASAFYVVRGTDCTTRKACTSDTDCLAPTEGTCVSRGPFGVPGRSLVAGDVTVSAASLTSSLITFFSPPKEVFRATSATNAGGVAETLTNLSTTSITVTIPAFPPGCCPADSDHPHQIRCGDECVDYLTDPNNCGGCGNICGDGTCCSDGNCISVCGEGQTFCDGECVYLSSDNDNCGACGNACGSDGCCSGSSCHSLCGEGQALCGSYCVDLTDDDANCGTCSHQCGNGTCCADSACASVCEPGWSWCDKEGCADLQNDNHNCGACGNRCGEGSCCVEGECAALECNIPPGGWYLCGAQCVHMISDDNNCGSCGHVCPEGSCCNGEGTCNPVCYEGETNCSGQCTELPNDNINCGACGNVCGDGTCCNGGTCVSVCPSGFTYCNGQCVDLNADSDNCGECGSSCESGCCNGGSCNVECPDQVPPVGPSCPNSGLVTPGPLHCPAQLPPQPATCANPYPTEPQEGHCPGDTQLSGGEHLPSSCPDVPSSTNGTCGETALPPPPVEEAPLCTKDASLTTIPPGGHATTCTPGGMLFKEVPTEISVCGDGLPGVNGQCNTTTSHVTTGTFNRLIQHPTLVPGNAFVTPFAVHVISDTSNDGVLEPGETGGLLIDVLNAGPLNINAASATLQGPPVDLTGDGLANPLGLTIGAAPATFGTIYGTQPSTDCTAPKPQTATNVTPFIVTVPPGHPGDTSHPLVLTVHGTVGGNPFAMDVPLSLGIADKCDPATDSRDFDGVEGLYTPMAKLVPAEDTVQFPSRAFNAGSTRPLKLRIFCGSANVSDNQIDPPQIVALTEATRGPIDLSVIGLNADNLANPRDPFFGFDAMLNGGTWHYNLDTTGIGTGTFTLTIRIAGRKDYVTGFVLE